MSPKPKTLTLTEELEALKADLEAAQTAQLTELKATLPTAASLATAIAEALKPAPASADVMARIEAIERKMSRPGFEAPPGRPQTPGATLVESDEYKTFAASKSSAAMSIEVKSSAFERKDIAMVHGDGGALDRGLQFPEVITRDHGMMRIRDLFRRVPVSKERAPWVKVSTAYEVYTELSEAEVSGDTVMHVDNASGFYVGQTIQIVGISGTADRVISDIDYEALTITLTAILGVGGAAANARVSGTTYTWTPEAKLSPSSKITLQELEEPIKDMPIEMTVSVNLLEDATAIRAVIDAELIGSQGESEDREFLYGSGTGREILGLFNNPDIQTWHMIADGQPGDHRGDAIRRAATQVALSHRRASAVLISEEDLEHLDLAKDDEGRYLELVMEVNGQPMIHRLRVVVSPEVVPGKSLVGAFEQVILWDRQTTQINVFRQHANYASQRLALIQAMRRAAFTVTRPAAFFIVDFLT